MSKNKYLYTTTVLALLLLSALLYTTVSRTNNNQTATTTPLIGQITDKPGAQSTIRFTSTILGLAWDITSDSNINEFVDTGRGDKKPFDTWTVSGVETSYMIRAVNPEIASYSYEGPGLIIKYGGEAVIGACATKSPFDQNNYEVRVLECAESVNSKGVRYTAFDIEYKNVSGYGSIFGPLFVKTAHAKQNYNRAIGIILQTRSAEFPGLLLYKLWYSTTTLSEIQSVKEDLQDAIDTMVYIR